MLRSYLITAFRAILRHRFHVIINVLGLAVGLAAALLVLIYARYETSYDDFLPNVDRTFRMSVVAADVRQAPVTAMASVTAQRVAKSMPEVEDLAALYPMGLGREESGMLPVRVGERHFRLRKFYIATPNLADFVSFKVIAGDLNTALNVRHQIALSRSEAERIFGNTEVLGRTIEAVGDDARYTVAAVFEDLPSNTHFDFNVLGTAVGVPDGWVGYTYVRLRPGTDVASLASRLGEAITARAFFGVKAGFHPVRDLHLDIGGVRAIVHVCIALSIVLILIASLNFVNMSTAQAGKRAQEIGMRKALGATRGRLVLQYLFESTGVALIAAVLAALLAHVSLPWFNELVNRELTANLLGMPGLLLLGLAIVVGVVAGLYPALYLSSFPVNRALSGDAHHGETGVLIRKALFVFQAALSAASIIGTIALHQQVQFLRELPTGYAKTGRLQVQGFDSRLVFARPSDALLNQLAQIPGVRSVTVLDRSLTEDAGSVIDIALATSPPRTITSGFSGTGFDFVKTLGLELVAGRDFSAAHPEDWFRRDSQNVERASAIITRSLAQSAGFKSPQQAVGQELKLKVFGQDRDIRLSVVGVVADVKVGSVKEEHRPIFFVCGFSWSNWATLVVNFANEQLTGVREEVRRIVGTQEGMQVVDYRLTEDEYTRIYQYEDGQAKLVLIFSVLAILLSCVGTFGLAGFSAQRRRKEFAIRRVQGASRLHLMNLLANEYLMLVGISLLVAVPMAFAIIADWLNQFSDRISQSVGLYVAAAMLLTAITWLTVSGLAFRAASVRPAESLRQD